MTSARQSLIITGCGFLLVLLLGLSAVAAAGQSLYSDFEIKVVSDNHLRVSYKPQLSSDFLNLGRGSLIQIGDKKVWGRTFLVSVPPDGEIEYTADYGQAATVNIPTDSSHYLADDNSLVSQVSVFEARRHRLVSIGIFPQRVENGRLAIYDNFVIDIQITQKQPSAEIPERLTRLDSVLAMTVINPDQFFRFGTKPSSVSSLKKKVALEDAAQWAKVTVSESGITKISGSALQQAGINLVGQASDSIRMFYCGSEAPSLDPSAAEPELYQIGIDVEDGGDGQFDAADYILFYAQALNHYKYTSSNIHPTYVYNPYNDHNVYWLAIGGGADPAPLRWASVEGGLSDSPDYILTSVYQHLRVEQNHLVKSDDHFTWYWSSSSTVNTSVNLPNACPGDSIGIELGALCNYSNSRIRLNNILMSKYASYGTWYWDKTGAAVPGLNSLTIELSKGSYSTPYLDYLNVIYSMELRYQGSQMAFNSYGYSGTLEYRIRGLNSAGFVLDVTDTDNPKLITGVEISNDTARFQGMISSGEVAQFVVYASNNTHVPSAVVKFDLGQLRSDLTQYDCLVISPRSFQSALQNYVDYRQEQGTHRVKFVALEDIYNDFGFGLESPMAIRNYLHFAYDNYEKPSPSAVILAGDGTYDYLDNSGLHTSSYVPPFIQAQDEYSGDDNYVYFGRFLWLDSDSSWVYAGDEGWDMMIARWPVRSSAEIAAYISKLKGYESTETQGIWRSRITYVADDEFKGEYIDNEIVHTAQAETLAVMHTPNDFVKQKIYSTDYSFASSGEKPAVNDAIVRAINEGTLIINYIGHGNPNVWADEHIFKKESDLARLKNVDKLATVLVVSCSIGMFDSPSEEGMAEMLFRQQGGAIVIASAIGVVFWPDNSYFIYDLYDDLFGNRHNVPEAVFAAKMLHQYSGDASVIRNDVAYVIFGDPLMKSGLPEYRIEMAPLADSTLVPLDSFGFTGRAVNADGDIVPLDGNIDIAVYDAPTVKHHYLGIDYSLGGPTIFRGSVEAKNGFFESSFIVPLDIDYGGQAAQIAGYGAFGASAGIGGLDSLKIADTATALVTDNEGPLIECSFSEVPDFVSGDRIPDRATLVAKLSDRSGINLTSSLGHRIELTLDNDNNTTMNLTDKFTYNAGSCRAGELQFTLPSLTPDRHTFRLRVWDNANNPSSAEFEATPSQIGRIAISGMMNYPNPMEEKTEFFFDLSESSESVELQIFTLSGRLIKEFRTTSAVVGHNRLFYWDGRDKDGDRVAEGIYIYKLTAKGRTVSGRSGDNKAEAFGKLILLN